MKPRFQQQYNEAINLISHLILTKPKPVLALLAKHGIVFKGKPTRLHIINEVVELLKRNDPKFEQDLGHLLTTHIQYRGKEMLALERKEFSAYVGEDEDEFWGALAKGAIGIVGGLFKKKKRSSGGNNAAVAASQAAAAQAKAQAAQAKRDMERRMREMQKRMQREREAEARRRREEEERRRRAEEERRKQEAEAKKNQTKTIAMVGGGIVLLAVIGIVVATSKSNGRAASYIPMPAATPAPAMVR